MVRAGNLRQSYECSHLNEGLKPARLTSRLAPSFLTCMCKCKLLYKAIGVLKSKLLKKTLSPLKVK